MSIPLSRTVLNSSYSLFLYINSFFINHYLNVIIIENQTIIMDNKPNDNCMSVMHNSITDWNYYLNLLEDSTQIVNFIIIKS